MALPRGKVLVNLAKKKEKDIAIEPNDENEFNNENIETATTSQTKNEEVQKQHSVPDRDEDDFCDDSNIGGPDFMPTRLEKNINVSKTPNLNNEDVSDEGSENYEEEDKIPLKGWKRKYVDENEFNNDIIENVQVQHSTPDPDDFSDDSIADPDFMPTRLEKVLQGSTPNLNNEESDEERETNEEEEEEAATPNRRPLKGRKRKYAGQTREIRKKLKNSNEGYIDQKGIGRKAKQFKDYVCRCKKRCNEVVSLEERKALFNKYWELANYNTQTALIGHLVKEVDISRRYSEQENFKRKYTRVYSIANKRVCREQFIKCLGVSTKRINTALNKIKSDSIVDKRGVHGGYNKIDNGRKIEVIDHINKFPKYKSHYRREQNNAEFLESFMTIQKMYSLYKEGVQNPVSYEKYKHIFYTNFNLRRKLFKKDTCNLCDKLDATMKSAENDEKREKIKKEHVLHLEAQESARKRMNADMLRATQDDTLEVLTFDMQKTLPLPRIPTNIVFYKRQIWLYNTGIHACKLNQAYCNTWVEGTSGRGAQEVSSCLLRHIRLNLTPNITELILWSDSCSGQNRNIKIILMLKAAMELKDTLKSISLRFLVSGHSFLKNDSDFGDIEKALKLQQRLYTEDDYMQVMRQCRKKNPMIVQKMSKEEFYGSLDLEKNITNKRVDVDGNKINWLKFKEIKIYKDKPYSIFVSEDNSGICHEVDLTKKQPKRKGRPAQELLSETLFFDLLKPLWPNEKPISAEKFADIQSMMHLIPEDCREFYENLKKNDLTKDYLDGYDQNVDFEFE